MGIAAVMALTGGFAQGGYTGNIGRRKVAGVVHGQEFVFDAEAVDRIGGRAGFYIFVAELAKKSLIINIKLANINYVIKIKSTKLSL